MLPLTPRSGESNGFFTGTKKKRPHHPCPVPNWLQVWSTIDFKIILVVLKLFNGMAMCYLSDFLNPQVSLRSLRSSDLKLLAVTLLICKGFPSIMNTLPLMMNAHIIGKKCIYLFFSFRHFTISYVPVWVYISAACSYTL